MGTNYYFEARKNECAHCGHADVTRRHIGKSSPGWAFALHVYPEEGIHDLEDWQALWPTGRILDEYHDEISVASILQSITDRASSPRQFKSAWLQDNRAVEGPDHLARSRIDERYEHRCIGHGSGTWDLMVGDFA